MSHTVTLLPSGHRFACEPTQEVLKAATAAGLLLPYSCRSGACNTCRGRVVDGQVDWGDVLPKYLSRQDKSLGYALLCQARPRSNLVIEVREIDAGAIPPSRYMPVRVLQAERVAPDVMVLTIGLPMNEPTHFLAGQYIEFLRPDGTRRSYSIASTPSAEGVRRLELHVRHLPGGRFTDHVFTTMRLREVHRIEAPIGAFFLREASDKPIVMIASGTGFAPIKSIVGDMIRRGIRRPVSLYWGGRRRPDLYMAGLCEGWAREHAHIRFVPVLSEPTPDCRWHGRTGYVHRAVMDDLPDLSGHEVYACGSPLAVDAARRDLVDRCGVPADSFFADAFLTAREKAGA